MYQNIQENHQLHLKSMQKLITIFYVSDSESCLWNIQYWTQPQAPKTSKDKYHKTRWTCCFTEYHTVMSFETPQTNSENWQSNISLVSHQLSEFGKAVSWLSLPLGIAKTIFLLISLLIDQCLHWWVITPFSIDKIHFFVIIFTYPISPNWNHKILQRVLVKSKLSPWAKLKVISVIFHFDCNPKRIACLQPYFLVDMNKIQNTGPAIWIAHECL
jgi:hypothetical protein